MADQSFEPRQLVSELRARLRIAIRQVKATEHNATHRRFDVATLGV
jgi:hypothetical protein